MLQIRAYKPRRDREAVRNLLRELLSSEKEKESEWPAPDEIFELYYNRMMKLCRKHAGKIFIADEGGEVAGFVTVLGNVLPSYPDEYPLQYAKITELVVNRSYQNRGIGRRLIAAAESYARQRGVSSIRLEASGANSEGRRFYTREGYRELVIEFIKKFDQPGKGK